MYINRYKGVLHVSALAGSPRFECGTPAMHTNTVANTTCQAYPESLLTRSGDSKEHSTVITPWHGSSTTHYNFCF